VESEWPPVEGECLGHYGCNYGTGYTAPCSPRQGEFCGELHYAMVARDHPHLLAATLAADACMRWRLARLNWLGEDHPDWLAEYCGPPAELEHQIRYGKGRDDG
jgi:hypothetical protein